MSITNDLLNRVIIPKLTSQLSHLTKIKIISTKKLNKKIILYLNYKFLVHFDDNLFKIKIDEEEYPKINFRYSRWATLKKPLEVEIDFNTNEIHFLNIYDRRNLKFGNIKQHAISPEEIKQKDEINLIKEHQNEFEIKNRIAPVKKVLTFETKTKNITEDELKDSLNDFVNDLYDDLNSSAENIRIKDMNVISRPEKIDQFKYKSVISLESNIIFVNSETYVWSNMRELKQRAIIHSEVLNGYVYHIIQLKPYLKDTDFNEIIDLDTEHIIKNEIKDEDGHINVIENDLRKKALKEIEKQFNAYDELASKYKRSYKI